MYIKLTNGQPEIYSIGQLRRDNPQVSFPKTPSNELLAEYDIYPVTQTESPQFTEAEVVESAGYIQLSDGTWTTAWTVRSMTIVELDDYNRTIEQQRQSAYQREADPLYFMWKRGESTEEEWLAKIQEIKSRYPYLA
jgi:hypothetical protein